MKVKRLFDLFFTIPGLLVLGPFMVGIALWIKIDTKGPVLFRQKRVGRYGRSFDVFKFRTMIVDAESQGLKLTVGQDSRITRSGAFLRKYKLDELPQLLNVLKGEMSLVGPRPEVPEYVETYPAEIKKVVVSVPPGITDYASIEFRNESDLLAKADDPQKVYVEEILPIKLNYYVKYVKERSLLVDIYLIMKTIKVLV